MAEEQNDEPDEPGGNEPTEDADLELLGKVEDFLERYEIGPEGCEALRNLEPRFQREVVSVEMTEPRNPTKVLLSRIRRALESGERGDAREDLPEELQQFVDNNNLDESAIRALKELPPDLQQEVMAEDVRHCRNPSAVLHSRIRRLTESRGNAPGPTGPTPDEVQQFIERHNVDSNSAAALMELEPHLQAIVMSEDMERCRNPSAVLLSRIGRARRTGSFEPSDRQQSNASKGKGKGKAAQVREPPPPPRPNRLEVPPPLYDGFARELDEFLRRHRFDDKSTRGLLELPPDLQRRVIDCDMTQAKNPSAFLWARVNLAQKGNLLPRAGQEGHEPAAKRSRNSYDNDYGRPHPEASRRLQDSRPRSPSHPPDFDRRRRPRSDPPVFLLQRVGGGSFLPDVVSVATDAEETALQVGRSPACHIRLAVQHISKVHAELRLQRDRGGGWLLMLLDVSSNGTWLNRQQVSPNRLVQLYPGDVVSFLPPEERDAPAYKLLEATAVSGSSQTASGKGRSRYAEGRSERSEGSEGIRRWLRSLGRSDIASYETELVASCRDLRDLCDRYNHDVELFFEQIGIWDEGHRAVFLDALRVLSRKRG